MVAAIQHKPEAESLVHGEKGMQQLKSSALSIDKPAEDAKCEDLVKVVIGDNPEREELIEFPKRNIDVFTWNVYEAPGVDPKFICHHLKVNPLITHRKRPPQHPSKEHAEALQEEVTRLKQAGAIKEVFYPEWLANTVVVKKKSGKW